MNRPTTAPRPSPIRQLLAIVFGLLLLGAGVVGGVHHHHGSGAGDASCAVCLASGTAAAITLPAAVPAAPTLYSEAIAPAAEAGRANGAPRRASSRAPPTA